MSKEEARTAYIAKVEGLAKKFGLEGGAAPSSSSSSSSSDDSLVITVENSVKTIRFNRPDKLNAFTMEMYQQITEELNKSSKDDSVKAIILTGTGTLHRVSC